jgi:topoisomerase IA-like protein
VAGGGPVRLGTDPDSGLEVTLRTGPYGPYLQLGEGQGKAKPKRVPLPKVSPGCFNWAGDTQWHLHNHCP